MIVSNGDFGVGRDPAAAKTYWGNNHGSLEFIGGQAYIFYHRQTNKNEQTRQGCAERITIAPDGKIAQAEMTSCGLNGGPLEGSGTYPAYIACNLRSAAGACKCAYGPAHRWRYSEHPCITMEDGRQFIQNMRRGGVAVFRYFDVKSLESVSATVRGGEGAIEMFADGADEPFAKIPIHMENDWTEFSAACSLSDGVHSLELTYNGEGACDVLDFTLNAKK